MENEENKELDVKKNITSNNDDDNNNNNQKANKLCIISLALAWVPNLIDEFFWNILPEFVLENFSSVSGICGSIALIIVIYVRVKYPKNIFGKVLMIFYIITGILAIVGACLAIVTCVDQLNNCSYR